MNVNRLQGLTQVVTIASHTFLPSMIPMDGVVVDLGANRGHFALGFKQLKKNCRYIAVEPTPALVEQLRLNSSLGLTVVDRAIAASNGLVHLRIDDNPEATTVSSVSTAESVAVQAVTLETLLDEHQIDDVHLLKCDIEGQEIPMILGASSQLLKRIHQITIEFHDFCEISSTSEVSEAIHKLKAHKFQGARFSRNNTNWCFLNDRLTRKPNWMIAKWITAPCRRAKHFLGQ